MRSRSVTPYESCTARMCIHVCPRSPCYTLVRGYVRVRAGVCVCVCPPAACGDWQAGGHEKGQPECEFKPAAALTK